MTSKLTFQNNKLKKVRKKQISFQFQLFQLLTFNRSAGSVGQVRVDVDVHQNFAPKSPKLSVKNRNVANQLSYGYENVLPKDHSKVDEKSVISTIVYDKLSYNTDTSTITSTSDDFLSTSDDEHVGERIKAKRRQLR